MVVVLVVLFVILTMSVVVMVIVVVLVLCVATRSERECTHQGNQNTPVRLLHGGLLSSAARPY